MKQDTKELHKNHRERLRERFHREGLNHLEPHVLLELILSYAIPRKDTNELAHRLMDAYGAFSAVLDADFDELKKFPGLGEYSATLLKAFPSAFRTYAMDKETARPCFQDMEKLGKYLEAYFMGYTREAVVVVLLNNRMCMIDCVKIQDGTVNESSLSARRIAEIGFAKQASFFVLAHCHPDGDLKPSTEDIQTTRVLQSAFNTLGMPLLEHIIVAGHDHLLLIRALQESMKKPQNDADGDLFPF